MVAVLQLIEDLIAFVELAGGNVDLVKSSQELGKNHQIFNAGLSKKRHNVRKRLFLDRWSGVFFSL